MIIKPEVVESENEREILLRQYLSVAGAALGEDLPPEAMVLAMTQLITQDLARLVQTNQLDLCDRLASGAPVEIPVLDTKNGQIIHFIFGGN